MFSSTLVHVPHASLYIPDQEISFFATPFLEREKLVMTDRYCDDLFDCGDEVITAEVSRLVVDTERFRSDADEEMSRVGMGAVYTRCSDGSPLRNITDEHKQALLKHYYDKHHRQLTAAVNQRLHEYGHCLIIDGHSFHPTPLPYESVQSSDRPDFCIGTDSFHTPSEIVDAAVRMLEGLGYIVKINSPFAGSIVPIAYYRKDARVTSIMIEINRSLYMNGTGEKTAEYGSIKEVVCKLVHVLEESISITADL